MDSDDDLLSTPQFGSVEFEFNSTQQEIPWGDELHPFAYSPTPYLTSADQFGMLTTVNFLYVPGDVSDLILCRK
jgi:hypothetical protein